MSHKTLTACIIASILLLGSLGVYAGLWYVTYIREKDLLFETAHQAELRMRTAELAALKKLEEETSTVREELATYILTDDGVTVFLEDIERVARGIGLLIETRSVATGPLSDTSTFEAFAFTFAVKGSFDEVARFLTVLESLPYQAIVERSVITRLGEQGTGGWSGEFSIRVTKHKKQ